MVSEGLWIQIWYFLLEWRKTIILKQVRMQHIYRSSSYMPGTIFQTYKYIRIYTGSTRFLDNFKLSFLYGWEYICICIFIFIFNFLIYALWFDLMAVLIRIITAIVTFLIFIFTLLHLCIIQPPSCMTTAMSDNRQTPEVSARGRWLFHGQYIVSTSNRDHNLEWTDVTSKMKIITN